MDNKKYKTGVVVGKFYPPHKGHHYLINTALENTENLTVLVCAKKEQLIPGELRAKWIEEIHPDANVMLIDDNIPEDQTPENYSKAWADYTIKLLGYAPDVAFTSEEYGKRWSQYMGSEHFLVDMERNTIPCSGTLVRSNPLKYLDFLEAPFGKGNSFFKRLFYLRRFDVLFFLTDGSICYPTAKKNILHIQS
ncbi:MAG: adenylyltransferase/cytidyltransferase family protein, partial [Candidatus Yanofskybacteria bacterium]|nr:adenylyltransferase/cytidyltransferase family protein [Candidatus Yanofskybacteria bacterium]